MPVIPIIIDTFDLARQFNIPHRDVNQICDNIAKTMTARYAENLFENVRNTLHSTKNRYMRNIRVIDSGRLEGTVMLDYSKDKLIQILEEGASAFDMKQKMLESAKVKIGKDGKKYLTIPFRWGNPGANMDSDVFSGIMPQEVYEEVKQLKPNLPIMGGGKRSIGLAGNKIPSPYNNVGSRPEIKASDGAVQFAEYQHKTSIYEGITKMQDGTTGQNRYFSFRRVSANSDPLAFVHPGIEAHMLMTKTLEQFNQEKELSHALDVEWNKLF